MARSVRDVGGELITVEVLVDGAAVPSTYLIREIDVTRQVNRIPGAEIVIADGDPSRATFEASESSHFVPGRKIEVRLGYQGDNVSVFKGLIVRQSLRLDPQGNGALVVGCSDKAVSLTVARSCRNFLNMTDSAAMTRIISDAGLSADVAATSGEQEHVLQAQSSGWDFLLVRAEANGRVILVDDGAVKIAKPDFADPELQVAFGESLSEMEIEMNAVSQLPRVTSSSWDASTQKTVTGSSSEPRVNAQGDISGSKLAEVLAISDFNLQTARPLDDAALTEWADAQLLKSRLSRIQGTVSFPGNPKVLPGTLIEMTGLGKRFNGNAYVSGVRHRVSEGEWITEISLGLDRRWFADVNRDSDAPPAAALTPGTTGLQIGKVLQVYEDPQEAQRIKVSLPLSSPDQGIWMRLASPYAGDKMGITFLPEVGDEVVIGFLNQDPNAAVVLGALHSSSRQMPFVPAETNAEKSIVTRSGLKVGFEDEKKILTILTPGGHTVTLNDESKTVSIVDCNSNKLEMSESGVTLSTPKDMTISADGSVSIKGEAGVTLQSPADVSVSGSNVSVSAEIDLSCEGGATASVSSSGETSIEGILSE